MRFRRWLIGAFVLGALGLLGWRVSGGLGSVEREAYAGPTFVARRGPLTIAVRENGTIRARDQVVLKSEVEGQTTILWLIEEGTHVKEGDLLVELDASELVERRTDRQIAVQNAEAAFVKAREELEIVKSQAESEVFQAELDLRFAEEDLKRYLEGEYPRQLKEAQSEITLAEEELKNAAETLRWSEKLFEEKYISQTELDRDRLAKKRAELNYQLAVDALDLLENYTHKRRVDELEAAVEQARRALDRVKRRANANVVQAEADLRAKQSEYERQKARLEKLDRQIAACKIRAPRAGMVVYATTGRASWRGNDEPLQEGLTVRERQELIHLPTTDSMMAEVMIHEASLEKIRPGLPVVVTVDALPGRVFHGEVTRISPLPDGRAQWLNPDLKIYPTEIDLRGDMTGLRTGMSCMAEIVVAEIPDAVYVPVQCVTRVKGEPTVWVIGPSGEPVPRRVEVGLDDNKMIHVVSGLEEGERVLLEPPLAPAEARRGPRPARPTTGGAAGGGPGGRRPGADGRRPERQGRDAAGRLGRAEGPSGRRPPEGP